MKSLTLGGVTVLLSYEDDPEELFPVSDERYAELKAMRYPNYPRSPEWKHISYELRNKWRYCTCCGTRQWSELVVHHLTYERRGGRDLDEDLQVLCRRCHDEVHGIKAA